MLLHLLCSGALALDNHRAQTPPLGWSSWNWNQTCTTRAMLEPQVEALVARGLVAAGYTVFMADCAGPSRAADGVGITLPEAQWPGGAAAWNAYLHERGLEAGFYTDYGLHGCCSCAWQTNGEGTQNRSFGDAGHVEADMALLASWGTDYVKVDSCQPVVWRDGKPDDAAQYGRFRDAIAKAAATVRPMTYSVIGFKGSPDAMAAPRGSGGGGGGGGGSSSSSSSSGEGGGGSPYAWLNATGNTWRSSADVGYSWRSLMQNLDAQSSVPDAEALAGPGGFSDLDMLMFGHPRAALTEPEQASHLGLWAVLKSPLLLSTDVAALTARHLSMLTSARMLNVSQDALGAQARRVHPVARFAAGGAVFGAPTENGYSTGPHQVFDIVPVTTPPTPTPTPARGASGDDGDSTSSSSSSPSSSSSSFRIFRIRHSASGLCLGVALGGAVELADCDTAGERWMYAGAAGTVVVSAANASQCLGLTTVAGAGDEYRRAAVVPCNSSNSSSSSGGGGGGGSGSSSSSTACWKYGSTYLNFTIGTLLNCGDGPGQLSLDAAPRDTTNVFAGPLSGGRWAALLFNRGDKGAEVTLDFGALPGVAPTAGAALQLAATEVWGGAQLGVTTGRLTASLSDPHSSLFVILSPPS
jgi:hypothetical protein